MHLEQHQVSSELVLIHHSQVSIHNVPWKELRAEQLRHFAKQWSETYGVRNGNSERLW